MIPAMEANRTRIVLLGKTGSGKSSLINSITKSDQCSVNSSPNSETKECQSIKATVDGRLMHFVDTPGVFDTDPADTAASAAMLKCIIECAPGPHAFLLVLKIEKYTVLEEAVVNIILKYFTEEALKYTTVVFTRGDDLSEGTKIEDWVKLNDSLNELVQKCGGRCHVFDNKHWKGDNDKYRNNKYQVTELLKTIDKTLADNGGNYYTNDMLKCLDDKIVKEMKQIKATLTGNVNEEEVHEKAKQNIFEKVWSYMKGTSVGLIVGALLGVAVLIPLMIHGIPCAISSIVVGAVAIGVGAAVGSGIQYNIKKRKERANAARDDIQKPLIEQENEEDDVQPVDIEQMKAKAKEKGNEYQCLFKSYCEKLGIKL